MTFKNYCKEHIGKVCGYILINLQLSAFIAVVAYLLCNQANIPENTSLIVFVITLVAMFTLSTPVFLLVDYLANKNTIASDISVNLDKKVTKERWRLKSITIKSNKQTKTYDHDDITLSLCLGGIIGLVSIVFVAYAGRAWPTNMYIFMTLAVFVTVTIVSTLILLFWIPLIAENMYSKDKEEHSDE